MKTKNSAVFRLITIAAMLAMLLSLAPLQTTLAADSFFWQYDDLAPNLGWSDTGQFNAGDISYAEGEVLPQKVVITGLTADNLTVYGFTIEFYHFQSPVCGYDYLADYTTTSRLFTPSPGPDEGGEPNGSLSTANGGIGGSMYTKGATLFGVEVGAATEVTSPGGLTTVRIPVTFTASATTATFYFGIAIGQDGGCGTFGSDGAGNFPGGSLAIQIMDYPIGTATIVKKSTPNKINPAALRITLITGYKWNDLNANAVDDTEPRLGGWVIDLYDCGTDSACATSTLITTTSTNDTNGVYFSGGIEGGPLDQLVLNNYYRVCEKLQVGWTPSYPDTSPSTYCSSSVQYTDPPPNVTPQRNFGNYKADWGDLPYTGVFPDLYPTLLAQNGPRHIIYSDTDANGLPNTWNSTPAIWLGAAIDGEVDGQPNASATGDDLAGSTPDDEDGVSVTKLDNGGQGTVQVTFNSSAATGTVTGYLVIWFDWNINGVFTPSEAFVNTDVSWTAPTETQNIDFTFPAGTRPTGLFAYRARLFTTAPGDLAASALAYTGAYTNGEVEDYIEDASAVEVSSPLATSRQQGILVEWQTFNETVIIGFRLFRSLDPGGEELIWLADIPAKHPGTFYFDTYEYLDEDVQVGETYFYWVEVIKNDGTTELLAPASATGQTWIYLPIVRR